MVISLLIFSGAILGRIRKCPPFEFYTLINHLKCHGFGQITYSDSEILYLTFVQQLVLKQIIERSTNNSCLPMSQDT